MKNVLPMRFRLLHHLSTVKENTVDDIMNALKSEYGDEKQFNKINLSDSLFSMKENGLIEDTKVELDSSGELCIYYSINDFGRALLQKYIPKSWKS